MPMWKVYYPEGAYTAEDKQEFAEAITGLYTQFNLPAFYVTALFHELPADMFYIGGGEGSGDIRVLGDPIPRRIPAHHKRLLVDAGQQEIAAISPGNGN